MPLTPEEIKIIEFGRTNGKSQDEVMSAISKYRLKQPKTITPTIPTAGVGQRVKGAVTGAGEEVYKQIAGEDQYAEQPVIQRGFGAAYTGLTTPLKAGFEALPQTARTGLSNLGQKIGEKFNWLTGKIAGTKLISEAAQYPEQTKGLESTLGTVASAGGISGDILAYQGVAGGLQKGVSVTQKGVSGGVRATQEAWSKLRPTLGKAKEAILGGKDSKLLSIFTGENQSVVEKALQYPNQADLGIKGGDVALRKAVQTGADTSIKARSAFIRGHSEAFNQLAGENAGKLLSRQKVLYQFVDDLKANGVSIKGSKADFTTSKIATNPGEVAKIKATYQAIQGWKDWSLKGTNELKQIIGAYTKFPTEAGGMSKSPFLGKFYNYLDSQIKSALPVEARAAYTTMNTKFSSNIELYNEMVDAFNSGDPFSKISQLFSSNKDSLRQIIDFYEKTTGELISPVVAGRTLAESRPAAFGFLNPRQWVDFFIDPKIQAEIVTRYGRTR